MPKPTREESWAAARVQCLRGKVTLNKMCDKRSESKAHHFTAAVKAGGTNRRPRHKSTVA